MGLKCVEHIDHVKVVGIDSKSKLGMDREVVNKPLEGSNDCEGFKIEDLFRVSQDSMLKTHVKCRYPESHTMRASVTKNSELHIGNEPFSRVQDMDTVRVLHSISKPNELPTK